MGYGFGGLLAAVGLILALAVEDKVEGVDLRMVGWILTAVGLVLIVGTMSVYFKKKKSVATTVHRDGSQTVQEHQVD